jgi:hypothetical protein
VLRSCKVYFSAGMHTVLTEAAWFLSVPKQMSCYIQLPYDSFFSHPFNFINSNQSFDALQSELLTTSLKNQKQVKFKFKDSGPRMESHILTVVRSAFRLHRASLYVSNVSSKSVLAKIKLKKYWNVSHKVLGRKVIFIFSQQITSTPCAYGS